ncbi:SDR family NAD(P)-dependent oxidoreductase [Mycobacterium sp. EPa45]|uniref:SDR family NAD(P)-dependent oxidoreductase n=1 Tax=Mycobacterium sp. EPa45 TaxID=1545728 RepID=UPI00064257FE|nr:SDR family NAD(P)-dependent oxidoreductase [Mycobacterium sp. EPa45]AKK30120.1 short-chain dehydrogenase [Mycobacterium sp. EPa45]
MSFADQVALVTGAGRGLGRTYALELARRGAKVVVNDVGAAPDGQGVESTPAQDVVAEITAAGGTAVPSSESIATPEGGAAVVNAALEAFGRLDVVISNAGILRDKTFAKMTAAEFDAVLDVHLRGAFFVSQPAFQAMKDNGYGRFVFTTSAAGLFGNFGQANYGAAKMGLVGLSSGIAIEGARYGIQSNVIAPLARTRLTDGLLGEVGAALDPTLVTPMVVYLASRECTATHEIYAAGAGWYGRSFVGLTAGWLAGPDGASVEDVAEHIDSIRDEDGYLVPLEAPMLPPQPV